MAESFQQDRSPLVSIMLPAKDADSTLEAAARSCLAQTFADLELLLIENDSTPSTRAIMEQLKAEDERVRIVRGESGAGFINALNLGWREARGQLLARMDADDLCAPARIAKQVEFLQLHPKIAACGTLVRIRRRTQTGEIEAPQEGYALFETWLNSVVTPDEIARERFVDSPIANPSAMIRRSVFDEIGGYCDVDWAEDYDFWLRMLGAGLQIGKVDEVLLDWFDSETRLTRNDDHYSQDRFLEAKAHFLAQLPVVRERGVAICGAGPIGKRLGRLLVKEGVILHHYFEVSQRRIGETINGVPVFDSGSFLTNPRAVILSAVGTRGGRDRVRSLIKQTDFIEGVDFFCVA